MKERRLPNGPRVIPSAFLSQVPDVIGARIHSQLKTVASHENKIVADAKRRDLKSRLKVLHLPTRDGFESLVLKGRIQTPEIKIDEGTNRVYLVGGGVPGRQERQLQSTPVDDEAGRIAEQIYTDIVEKDNIVIAYTEVSLEEFKSAADKTNELADKVVTMNPQNGEPITAAQGLSIFFRVPMSHMTGMVMALHNQTKEELESISLYALKQKGYY